MKQVKVYGPGCKRCDALVSMIKEAAEKAGVAVDVDKITDYAEIAQAGVASTPGLSVDGKLVHAGGLPDPSKVESWLSA
ncbi:MAG: thioredoxin family protein [Parvularcula sp.]